VAQVDEEFRDPGLRYVLSIPCGLERAVFSSLGQNRERILKFSVFLFLGKQND
jgi:hypothetical protein